MPFSYEVQVNSQRIVVSDADLVVVSFPVPQGGSLDNWSVVQRVIGEASTVTRAEMFGNSAYMCQLDTPDSSMTPDLLWDSVVPDDTAVALGAGTSEIDIDFDTANTTVELEPGIPDLQALIDGSLGPKQIMQPRLQIVTFADSPTGFESATPDTYLPRAKWSRKSTQKVNADMPSMALWGFSSPALTATSAAWVEFDSVGDWVQLQYLEYVLEMAWIEISGLTEVGAESPWADAVTLIVEAAIGFFEAIPASWNPIDWTVFTSFRGIVTVPGKWSSQTLRLGS